MKTKIISLFTALIFFSTLTEAQVGQKIGSDIKDFFHVGGNVLTSPLHFDSKDWINFSAVTSVIGGSFFLDNTARSIALRNHNNTNDNIFSFDKNYIMISLGAATAGIYGYGLFSDNDKIRNLGVQLGESVIYAGAINLAAKSLFGRSRPFTERGHTDFHPFSISDDKVSFPSGHTTVAFAFSTVMAHAVDNIFWKAGWYGFAGMVAVSRIYHDKHWVSDVIFGGAIGYFVGRLVVNHPLNNPGEKQASAGIGHLVKKINKPFYSVGLNFRQSQPVYTFYFGYQF